ncbi:MAG: 50S ribosomal protein L6 [Candidatus Sungbacteria bacterium RIFCSPLOWO2_01_FULL_59_16]|uniref:Large ribosomal subunit protein uL6 n=1 Tax=Candidatus Sungbacteria bacterium RIFCSPLOWO2_01_FULL_59_16 TaxID=1802280 RepID=A0A1G2LBK5_9BACT|nr:MAG: 50S ribosomal protein L6 [Candidatus Sungbacteria bacterium RIFCSPLOWO2_01_FULL_59_16]
MSRIGKKPIVLPEGVRVTQEGQTLTVSGPKGSVSRRLRPEVEVRIEGTQLVVRPALESRRTSAYWGLTRSLLFGMVEGVSQGVERKLEIEGIGYRATTDGREIELALGFSHPVKVTAPEGVAFRVEKNVITVAGVDRELVGNVAAAVRSLRPPEPYKGKGIRFAGEFVRRKAGKKAMTAGT